MRAVANTTRLKVPMHDFWIRECKLHLITEKFATESGEKRMASTYFTTDYNIRKRDLPHVD
ncbi:hypothetical protein RO3G_07620 [Rhizopus delemar RA 99-880]|uniref:Uncharacterized protein n=1 Tax=Rhizopus delemar (strain RA 99-880 / ATCC MYA-4621 / FGSC 9543 / NRRL 43880) TaxID=246409 RepID=I1C385_RHIO9|nr:hypothetical protein RO3G_07620 [Rhizopus delemar RA 99-880]|eukprot:EIE82915.1 hypothetical protein RO3G_07620 [Rhizopus delemar RA 99-880]